ncbi:MAG: MarR family transcriptional regulator [Candidatus Eisenbacteria bacterium]|uniref:MarR family transcriptional regulator n=1 Tax=Eiseniibacteriota bacterium TaxID=2212470 RepID=A0A538SW50_UNCEI|nr:MAG: MarR family transcriptional regulator [Candidatus Eisenbacteria bacterium]TMQ65738.1 MAG: MarR family transcriptional regulator [Candidatus Eisenbacteria bacterium]
MALRYLSPIHRAVRQITLYLEPQCLALGVSPAEGHLLSYLRTYAPCPIVEIVRVFGIRPSTMTSILERLAERGLILRTPDPDDRRSVQVTLTREGRAVAERINRMIRDLEVRIGTRVGKRELAGFRSVMGAVEAATGVRVRKERST